MGLLPQLSTTGGCYVWEVMLIKREVWFVEYHGMMDVSERHTCDLKVRRRDEIAWEMDKKSWQGSSGPPVEIYISFLCNSYMIEFLRDLSQSVFLIQGRGALLLSCSFGNVISLHLCESLRALQWKLECHMFEWTTWSKDTEKHLQNRDLSAALAHHGCCSVADLLWPESYAVQCLPRSTLLSWMPIPPHTAELRCFPQCQQSFQCFWIGGSLSSPGMLPELGETSCQRVACVALRCVVLCEW